MSLHNYLLHTVVFLAILLLLAMPATMFADTIEKQSLYNLAVLIFRKDGLSECEEKVLHSVDRGIVADCKDTIEENNNIVKATSWDDNRIVRANILHEILTNPDLKNKIKNTGIHIVGAKIVGTLNISFLSINVPVRIVESYFPDGLSTTNSYIAELWLGGSRISWINASSTRFNGFVGLNDNFISEGKVNLMNSKIAGQLDCSDGHFMNKNGYAIIADGIQVHGPVFLNGKFESNGETSFKDANISGTLECGGGQFYNDTAIALNADRINVRGGVYLNNTFSAKGEVRFIAAKVGGDICCSGGSFLNKDRMSLGIERAAIRGDIYLNKGMKSIGKITLLGSIVGGSVKCNGGQFFNPGKCAVDAESVSIKGNLDLRDANMDGGFCFPGAHIEGQLGCSGAKFINPKGIAIWARSVHIDGNAFIRNITAEGDIIFDNALVGQNFQFKNIQNTRKISLDLSNAKIETLDDDAQSWPSQGRLILNGLSYDKFSNDCKVTKSERLNWLSLQEKTDAIEKKMVFSPQPYEQLASVYREQGYEDEAMDISIAKNRALLDSGRLDWWDTACLRFLGVTIGFGYRPWRALWAAGFFIFLGWYIFHFADRWGFMVPTNKQNPEGCNTSQKFNAFMYSLDMFIPIVNFYAKDFWLPNAYQQKRFYRIGRVHTLSGEVFRIYLWLHIALGWACSTLIVLGFSGLIKR
ncbi:hypothetical protein [Solidesulfovibrio sp. C21]|uniref:hypothetical protein n=1 Tax=Solidesulfovibrio sp. C21 TaxID=3398613 RepID=UPI0039FCA92E